MVKSKLEKMRNTELQKTTETIKKTRRTRSSGFPVISLEEAIDALKKAAEAGFEMSQETFASQIKMSPKGSAFLLKLAALRDFKLIERTTKGIVFSELAKNIINPTTEDEAERKKNSQTAFRNCKIFNDIFEHLSPSGFKKETVGNVSIREFNISPKSQGVFVKSFIDSGKFASLIEETEEGLIKPISMEEPSEDRSLKAEIDSQKSVAEGEYVMNRKEKGEGWDFNITINSTNPLTKEIRDAVERIISYLEADSRKQVDKQNQKNEK